MSAEAEKTPNASGRIPPTTVTREPFVTITPENVALLKTFPLPPNDNGRGLHFHLDLRDEVVTETVEHLQSINATWTQIYAPDPQQAQKVSKACWDVGIMPVMRIGKKIDEGFDAAAYVRAMQEVGAPPYIQIYNEPNDNREWKDKHPPSNWKEIFARNWAREAARVYDAGGYPGIQVLDQEEFDRVVDAVRYNGRDDIWDRAWFNQHNYGSNHPPDYPYDPINQEEHPGATILDDPLSILSFLAYAHWMKEKLGFVLPIIGGEGGWPYERLEDRRYPKAGQPYHADFHKETFDWFRTGVISNGEPLPDYLFSVTPWLAGSWDFPADNWWRSLSGDRDETIAAVASIPPFVRKFSWDLTDAEEREPPVEPVDPGESMPGGPLEPGPDESEPEQPEPEQPQPEEPEPEIPEIEPTALAWDARLDGMGVRLERAAASPAWRLVAAEYTDGDVAGSRHHIDFLALDGDGNPATGVGFVQDWVGRRDDERPARGVTNTNGETNVPIWISFEPERKNGIIFTSTADAPGDTVYGMGRPHYRNVVFRLTYQWGE